MGKKGIIILSVIIAMFMDGCVYTGKPFSSSHSQNSTAVSKSSNSPTVGICRIAGCMYGKYRDHLCIIHWSGIAGNEIKSGENVSLDAMLETIEKKEKQAKLLKEAKYKEEARKAEEAKKKEEQKKMAVMKQQRIEQARKDAIREDIRKYMKIVSSEYGKDMKEVAWKSLVSRHPEANDLAIGDINGFRRVLVGGIISLRSYYNDLSVSQVQSMPNMYIRSKEDWGFYGYSTINHSYSQKKISGDKVVLDRATGLMWHQNGSDDSMIYKEAMKWLKKRNKRGYAGYHDWRLPTVEEAATLLESRKSPYLYINSMFSNKQWGIWTCDSKFVESLYINGSEDVWSVGFDNGYVYWNDFNLINYVRPVRSLAGSGINNTERVDNEKVKNDKVVTASNESHQQAPKARLVYKADTSKIRAELQAKGYDVLKVNFGKNDGGMYNVSAVINTNGNYDKETLAIYHAMFDNATADLYYAQIVDYEMLASWMFKVKRQTLADYFSGKISEQQYINSVQPIKIK
jgi:hypothetical protein